MNKKRAFILMIFLVSSIFFVMDFVKADSGCYYYDHYFYGGVPGCKRVYEWGNDQALKSKLLNKAENNPGTRYMAWCPYQGANPTIRSDYKLNTCDCPSVSEFNLDPGECDTKKCSNCNNYVTLCSPEPEPGCVEGYKKDNVGIGLPSWRVHIQKVDDSSLHFTRLTDGTGFYEFSNLEPGIWDIWEEIQTGWEVEPGYSDSYRIRVNSGGYCEGVTFINRQLPKYGCVEGIKRDDDHVGLSGWAIHARKIGSSTIYTKISGSEGTFRFDNLEPGRYEFWEEMQTGWEPVTDPHFDATVEEGPECIQIGFKNKISCVNECSPGDMKCVGKEIWECGDFNQDGCYELGFDEDCYFSEIKDEYSVCENNDVVYYQVTEEGFCNDQPGYSDFCDSRELQPEVVDIEDCGEDTQDDEFCQGENIVYGWETNFCVEETDYAYCDSDSGFELVDECGPNICISHTELDPFVFEYVDDLNSCETYNNDPFCAPPENPVDMCLNEDILRQPFCDGSDHDWQSFDCNQYDGCYEFEVDQCFYCPDNYGNCYEKTCTMTGLKYIDYQCGSGVCFGVEKEMVDADKDHKDDEYCDDCIDVDRDGICDDVDNCPGIKNSNQIDNDKDGYGNACDLDRDGDGYPEGIDCNDWDPKIHPGAKEIPNNGRDEDCNSATPDFIPNTPREILYVDIQMQDEATLRAGEEFTIVVSVTNRGLDTIGDLRLSVSLPSFQERQAKLIRTLKSGDASARIFTFRLPEDLKTKYEYLRVSVSNDKYKRIIYREVKLPQ